MRRDKKNSSPLEEIAEYLWKNSKKMKQEKETSDEAESLKRSQGGE